MSAQKTFNPIDGGFPWLAGVPEGAENQGGDRRNKQVDLMISGEHNGLRSDRDSLKPYPLAQATLIPTKICSCEREERWIRKPFACPRQYRRGTFVRGAGGDDHGGSIARLGLLSVHYQSIGGVCAEPSQETVDPTDDLEGLKVLGVDKGGKVVRLEGERGGVDGLVWSEINTRLLILTLLLLAVEGVSGRSDRGNMVGRGGRRVR